MGKFANNPMTSEPTMAAIAVAVRTLSNCMPVPSVDKMPAFTTRMYDIAKNVVNPARNSVATEVPRSSNLKNLFSKSIGDSLLKIKFGAIYCFFLVNNTIKKK